MLFDLEMSSITSRQLGQHAAHHMWSCIMQDLSVMPDVEVTLQQVSCSWGGCLAQEDHGR